MADDQKAEDYPLKCFLRFYANPESDTKQDVELTTSGNDVIVTDKGKEDTFNFADPILEYRTQKEAMIFVGEPICKDICDGYNSSLITFGNRKGGKTFTIFGKGKDTDQGLLFRITTKLFDDLSKDESVKEWIGSYMAVHVNPLDKKENIFDLLCAPDRKFKDGLPVTVLGRGWNELKQANANAQKNGGTVVKSRFVYTADKKPVKRHKFKSYDELKAHVVKSFKAWNKEWGYLGFMKLKITKSDGSVLTPTMIFGDLASTEGKNMSTSALATCAQQIASGDSAEFNSGKVASALRDTLTGNWKTRYMFCSVDNPGSRAATMFNFKFSRNLSKIKLKVTPEKAK